MAHVAGLSVAFSDNVDYDNAFVGQYDLGDVQYLKHVYVRASLTSRTFEYSCSPLSTVGTALYGAPKVQPQAYFRANA